MKERNILLLVDDMEINRIILREVFRKEYRILEAEWRAGTDACQ